MRKLDDEAIAELIKEAMLDTEGNYSAEEIQKGVLVSYCSLATDAFLLKDEPGKRIEAVNLVNEYKIFYNYSEKILNDKEKEWHREQIQELEKSLGIEGDKIK